MSPAADHRFAHDPELAALHAALTDHTDIPDDISGPDNPTGNETASPDGDAAGIASMDMTTDPQETELLEPDRLESDADILSRALDASMVSPLVRRYVSELLRGGENPTPAVRRRLIGAADRGLRNRRANRAPLPTLLAHRRVQADISVTDLAETLQTLDSEVYRMELGDLNVRQLSPERIVTWIRAVQAEPGVAVDALRRMLERSAPARSAQAAGRVRPGELTADDQRLIDEVTDLLNIRPS